MARSAPSVDRRRAGRGSDAGSWDRSASISTQHVVAALEAPGEPGPVGGAEALLRRPSQHRDPPSSRAGRLGQVGGAVRAAVVDHQHVGRRARRPGPAAEDVGDVLGLLVGRDHDQRAHTGHVWQSTGDPVPIGTLVGPCLAAPDRVPIGRIASSRVASTRATPSRRDQPAVVVVPAVHRRAGPRLPVHRRGGALRRPHRLGRRRPAVHQRLRWHQAGIGAVVGAALAAGGVAVVAVLVLRAMGEWRTIQHTGDPAPHGRP